MVLQLRRKTDFLLRQVTAVLADYADASKILRHHFNNRGGETVIRYKLNEKAYKMPEWALQDESILGPKA